MVKIYEGVSSKHETTRIFKLESSGCFMFTAYKYMNKIILLLTVSRFARNACVNVFFRRHRVFYSCTHFAVGKTVSNIIVNNFVQTLNISPNSLNRKTRIFARLFRFFCFQIE